MSKGAKIKYTDEFLVNFIKEHQVKLNRPIGTRDIPRNITSVICRRYGWNNFLAMIGLQPHRIMRSHIILDKERKQKIVKMYNDGLSSMKIAEQFGCTSVAVRNWLKQAGVKMRRNKDYDLVNWDREPTKYKTHGYIMVRFPGTKQAIPEHRLIMEQKCGRKLKPNEIVHHLNAIKTDNRPENLVIIPRKKHNKHPYDANWKKALQSRIRELEEQLRNC